VAEFRVLPDAAGLAQAAAELFAAMAAEAIAVRGLVSVMLSGGSTPRAMNARFVAGGLASQIDVQRTHFFWGDERCVPPDHSDSNYRMARESLLDPIGAPPENVHRIHGEDEPENAAIVYEADLRNFFAAHPPASDLPTPRFDLIWLGMGDDGHTASLFPRSAAVHEALRWVVAVPHTTPPPPLVPRVTVTPVVINAAARVVFLVSGQDKAERLHSVIAGEQNPDLLPSQIVRPAYGRLTWMVDSDAARQFE
jgi:6-phosphogluconolactonase